jgi:adenylyltransferase/sulfurtransferase
MRNLSSEQLRRYQRNVLLKGIGRKGQRRLLYSKVLVVGAGGLGSSAAYYLAAAGTGTIGLADGDTVELSNLQRQILHFTRDVGKNKTQSAARKLKALNSDVKCVTFPFRLTPRRMPDIIQDFDFVLDCTDNFDSKFLINDACVLIGKPFTHCGVSEYHGQIMTYVRGSACYRCVFGDPPPEGEVQPTSVVGILGAVPGAFGCLQAAEAIKFITGAGQLLTNRLLMINMLDMEIRTVGVGKNPRCAVCGTCRGTTG